MSRADVSEQSVCSIFIGVVSRNNNGDEILPFTNNVFISPFIPSNCCSPKEGHKLRPNIVHCQIINENIVVQYVEGRGIGLVCCTDCIWPFIVDMQVFVNMAFFAVLNSNCHCLFIKVLCVRFKGLIQLSINLKLYLVGTQYLRYRACSFQRYFSNLSYLILQ